VEFYELKIILVQVWIPREDTHAEDDCISQKEDWYLCKISDTRSKR